DDHDPEGRGGADPAELERVQQTLIETLAHFGIAVAAGDITKGPTITRYEVYPAKGVRVDKIVSLERDLARATRAERINILAPIPGKDTVGIELANTRKATVKLRDLLQSPDWEEAKAHAKIPLALGKDVYGKRIITDPKKVLFALRSLIDEMEGRYKMFARVGVRNIVGFNARPKKKPVARIDDLGRDEERDARGSASTMPATAEEKIPDKIPYIVVIIDELADLMQTAPADVETAIARITQMARAAGIHLVVATQT